MIVETRTKLNIDTEKWAEIWDTDGQLASDVRRDIREWARETLEAQAAKEGFLIRSKEGEPKPSP